MENKPKQFRHGLCKSKEYNSWSAMIQRCSNKNNVKYEIYGGRGIVVCDRWKKFANFLEDMGNKPSPEHSLDRHPNMNGNYEPGNVRWATPKEQAQNRTNNRWFEYNGKRMVLEDWLKILNVNERTFSYHLNKGLSFGETYTRFSDKKAKSGLRKH